MSRRTQAAQSRSVHPERVDQRTVARRRRRPLARRLAIEQFEKRLVLSFFTSIGGCEPIAEHGRAIMQAAATRTADLSPGGESLAPAYRDAVVATMRKELGDVVADSMAATLDRVRVHWNSTLTDTDIFGGIDIGSALGQTFGNDIYLEYARPSVAYSEAISDLILHEIVHTRQYESFSSSLSNFGYQYFKKWCQAGFSYEGNSLESDARAFVNAYASKVYAALWPVTQQSIEGIGSQSDGRTQEVTWNLNGRIDEAVIELFKKNGTAWNRIDSIQHFLSANSLNSVSGGFNFDSQGQGSFRLTVSISTIFPSPSGTGSSTKTLVDSDDFTVGDDDSTGPTIVLGGVGGTIDDATPRLFTWQASDSSGISSTSATLTGPGGSLLNSSAHSGSFDFTSYGPGSFTLQTTSTDGDNDGGNDPKTGSAFRPVVVQDDDPNSPQIAFSAGEGVPLIGAGYSESHGLRNAVAWTATDSSGVDLVNASLWRDATYLGTFQSSAIDQLLLDDYGLGTFRIEVAARDGDIDGWIGDQLTGISSAYLTITNAVPTVFAGGPYLMQEGRLLELHAQGSDVDPGDFEQLTYAWDLDNDGQFDDAVGADPVVTWEQWIAAGVDDNGSYPVRVRVSDSFDATAVANATLTVLNAPPQIASIHSAPDIDENSELTVTGAFEDPSPADSHDVRVYWGDGTNSLATVDAIARTFSAVHFYADDAPSGTAVDEYLLRVEVTDDDGATNPPASRTLTVETNRVGGIELPSFTSSLPTGVSGLLQSAQVFADPLPVATSAEVAQLFNHQHLINYPQSGPFDLQATWTNANSVAGSHTHSFDISSSSQTFSGSSLGSYFLQSGDVSFPMSPRQTEADSSGLPAGYTHEHGSGDVAFTTQTTFTYRPPDSSAPVVSSNMVTNGGAESLSGWLTWRGAPGRERYGAAGGWPTQSQSCGTPCGTYFFWGGLEASSQFYRSFAIPSNLHARVDRGDILIDLSAYLGGFSSQGDYSDVQLGWSTTNSSFHNLSVMTGPSASERGNQTGLLFRNSLVTVPSGARYIEVNLRMYRTDGTGNDGYLDNVNLRFRDRSLTTTTESRSGTNQYILPRFNTSLGSLISAAVTLDAGTEITTTADGGQFLHDHDIDLEIPPFLFSVVNTTDSAATQTHTHSVDFAPIELEFTSDADLRSYFLQTANVVLAQPAIESTISLNHDHTIPAGTIPLRAVTTYTYDVASSLVRVHNKNPRALSVALPGSAVENSTVQLAGSFQDDGAGDTHQVLVDWGDGTSETLSMPFGQYDFQVDHEYTDDRPSATPADDYTVTVTAVDDDGGTVVTSRVITLLNELPVLALALSASTSEGAAFAMPVGAFTDRGQDDSHLANILWGDGSSSTATITQGAGAGLVSGAHVFLDDGNYSVQVTLLDDDGGESIQTMQVSVANVAPVIERLWTEGPAVEGTGLTLRANATDLGADVLTYTWDFGDGSPVANGVNLNSIAHIFADEGTYTITLMVDDGDGGVTTRALTVVVADISTGASMSGAATVVEGATYTLTLSAFTPAAASAIASWVVDWGDGSTNNYPSDGSVTHVYPDGPASHTVHVEVVKSAGGVSTIGELTVEVANAAPRITSLTGDGTGTEGDPLRFVGAATDAGADELIYAWDFGDGSVGLSGVDLRNVEHVFTDDGAYAVTLTVTDDDGEFAIRQFGVLVANTIPTISLSGASQSVEGSPYALTLGGVADPGLDTVTQWIVHWGDGRTSTHSAGGVVTHEYSDGPESHTIRVSLVDEDGVHRDVGQRTVEVTNAPPAILSMEGSAETEEGQFMDLSATVADPAGPYDLLAYRWDFGDGSASVQGVNLASVRHWYSDDGDYTVTLQVTDEDGASMVRHLAVSVANSIPLVVMSGPETATEGQPYGITLGSVFDPGTDVVTQWIVDWGDGQRQDLSNPTAASHVYADGPHSVEITLTLVDEDGQHVGVAQLPLTILNAPPSILFLSGQVSGVEGGALEFAAQAGDVSADALRYDWDFGDGSAIASGIGLDTVSHAFADDGVYLLTLTVDDGDGGVDSASLLVEVQNSVPTMLVSGPSAVFEGQSTEFTLGMVTDAGPDTVTEWIVDWGDDTATSYSNGGVVAHTFADGPKGHTIRVTLIDEDGVFQNAGSLVVDVVNRPPAIDAVHMPAAPREGQELEFTVEASDAAGESDTLTYTWDFGDGATAVSGVGLTSASHIYADDGIFTVRVTVADEDGGQDLRAMPLVVANVAPTVQLAGSPTALEAVTYELTLGTITDPGQDAVTQWVVDWGDGTQSEYASGGVVSHLYPDGPLSRTITVSVIDEDGTHLAAQRIVSVGNSVPELNSIEGDTAGIESDVLSFAAAASDPAGAADPLTYTWDFGDGSDSVSGVNLTAVAHAFADDGAFSVRLVVTDDDGGSITDFIDVLVANVAPEFEAGGGELLLPPVVGAFQRTDIQFTDPGADVWSGTVNYQDGTGDLPLAIDQDHQRFNLNHVFVISGVFDVTVTVQDDEGDSHTDVFQLEVILNTPPLAQDDRVTTNEDAAVTFDALADHGQGADTDAEDNLLPALTTVLTAPTRGVLTNHHDGSFTFDPSGDFEMLAVGESATATFLYQIEDAFGETDTARATVVVAGRNDTPVVSADSDSVAVDEGTTASLSGHFADVDVSDRVVITASRGQITQDVGSVGSWNWTFIAADGPSDSQLVVITADDGKGGIVTTTFGLTVRNVAPTLTVVADQSVNQARTLNLTNLGTFTDPGYASSTAGTVEEFVYSIDWGDASGNAGPATLDVVGDAGTASAGSFDGSHAYALPGIYTVTVTVYDDDGGSDTATFRVTVDRSILLLNPSISGALHVSGNGVLDIPGSLLVNSNSSHAIFATGNAIVAADGIYVAGGVETSGNAVVGSTPVTGSPALPDPLAALPVPGDDVGRGSANCAGNSTVTLAPGVYTSISIAGNCRATFQPGIYVVRGGEFAAEGDAVLDGSGVVIYQAGSSFPNAGGTFNEVSLGGNVVVNMTPPMSGPYRGVLLFQARDNSQRIKLDGDLSGMAGTVYARAAQVTMSGNAQSQLSLVVDRLKLSGNAVSRLVDDGDAVDAAGVPIEAQGQLLSSVVEVGWSNSDVAVSADQRARLADALVLLNGVFEPLGITLVSLDSANSAAADVKIDFDTGSPCGAAADGVLGCTTASSEITILANWNWYAGADATQIGVDQFDFQSVLTHELGHAIGLEHSGNIASVMHGSLTSGQIRRHLAATDLALLEDYADEDGREPEALRASFASHLAPHAETEWMYARPDLVAHAANHEADLTGRHSWWRESPFERLTLGESSQGPRWFPTLGLPDRKTPRRDAASMDRRVVDHVLEHGLTLENTDSHQ